MTPSIFVQIASYRDPELIPTLRDLIDRAEFPCRLRIVVCWQHAPDEHVGLFFNQHFLDWRLQPAAPFSQHRFNYGGASVLLIDVPHEQSQGACWARHQIQQHYQNETYTLQLDSHHRFAPHWDSQLIGMLESLRPRSAKPLLTAYLPAYRPGQGHPAARDETAPLGMRFERFTSDGPILCSTFPLTTGQALREPVPARFYSGHFTFTDGAFCREVQHDPDYFFHGEEISIAVRAYTHGYDLYHPQHSVAWHEYTRAGRRKIWDDHDETARVAGRISQTWRERNSRSLARNRALFGMDERSGHEAPSGAYGFGAIRTLADYERYAGISFRDRAVQPDVLADIAPAPPARGIGDSRPGDSLDRSTLRRSNDMRVLAHRKSIDILDDRRATHCTVQALHEDGTVLHDEETDIQRAREHYQGDWFDRRLVFMSDLGVKPAAFRIILRDAQGAITQEFQRAAG